MNKRLYRYFYGFADAQQRFLNLQASQGWRLIRTGHIAFVFEPCTPGAYQYCVDFVAHKSEKASRDYQRFLEDMGYRVMAKPINLNLSLGKLRLRPWGEGWGKVATSPGAFNRELLIVEKANDGQPFHLHTTPEDQIAYYRALRAAWGWLSLCMAAFAIFLRVRDEAVWKTIALSLLALLHLWPALRSQLLLRRLKTEAEVSES